MQHNYACQYVQTISAEYFFVVDLGERFRQWLDLTYGDVPSLSVVSKGEISQRSAYNWLSSKGQPGAEALRALHSLGCDITWLITGNGDMFAESESGAFWAAKNDSQSGGKRKRKLAEPTEVDFLVAELDAVLVKYRR